MTKPEAEKILAHNVLHLQNAGLDYFPMQLVSIEKFEIDNDQEGSYAELIGCLGEDDGYSYKCSSFFVSHDHDYWYCDFFHETLNIIEALRVVHEYQIKKV